MRQTAQHYGRALVELAKEKGSLDSILLAAKQLILDLQVPELQVFLEHPKVPSEGKREILQRLTSVYSPPEFRNFLNLIIDRRRGALLLPILETVVELTLKTEGYEIVELISAQPLSENEQDSIRKYLEKAWQKKVSIHYRENLSLIGGIIIRRGDELIDGSLSGQLNALKRILIEETNMASELS